MRMSEIDKGGNGIASQQFNRRDRPNWIMSPKEFVFKYLYYLPWVGICVFFFLFLAYIKIRYSVPVYRVQSSLLIKSDRNGGSEKDERFEELFMAQGTTNLSNETEIIRSRPVLSRVARDLGLETRYISKGSVKASLLYPDYYFRLDIVSVADSSAGIFLKVTVLDDDKFMINENKTTYSFGQEITLGKDRFRLDKIEGVNINSFGSRVFEVRWAPVSSVVEELVGGLKISQPNDQATILYLSFESENAALGRDVLNTLMRVYDTIMVEDKNRIADNTLRFINARLDELSDTLRGVQGGLKNFMVQNKVFDIENQSKAYFDKLGETAKEKAQVEIKIAVVDYLLQYISDKKNLHELVPTNLGIDEPALLQLVSEYNKLQLERDANIKTTPKENPLIVGMDNTLDKIRRNIYQALQNVRNAYLIASGNAKAHDEELQSLVTSLPGKSMQMLNIERRQKILEDLYSLLLQKKLDISLSSASTISNSKVIEPAVGGGMLVSPDKKKIFSFYTLLGLLLPVGFIVLKEVLQDKVNGRQDIEKHTDAPILGEIGHSEDGKSPLVVSTNRRSLVAEQFRIIRTNLQYILGGKESFTILVTSSFSGEGKSFISTNMGAALALSGKKTVIMEFDIRKPKIVSGLDLKRKMGISNYIIGKAEFRDLLVKVNDIDNLYVIPCGPIPPNPAELLLDKRLEELMEMVRANFDVVVMDTAPVGLVSDAITLSRFADCTLYIIRQDYTFRKQLRFIDDIYNEKKLPSLSVMLNDVKAGGNYYGGYGYYGAGYGYGYGSGYFEEPEKRRMGVFGRVKWWKKKASK